jgi:hypothetical protein
MELIGIDRQAEARPPTAKAEIILTHRGIRDRTQQDQGKQANVEGGSHPLSPPGCGLGSCLKRSTTVVR